MQSNTAFSSFFVFLKLAPMGLNNWIKTPIIRKKDILNFQFLDSYGYLEEIEKEYYCLNTDFSAVELEFYKKESAALADRLGIEDVRVEIKRFIQKLSLYNELKDIAQALLGRIADLKGITIKDVHSEFCVPKH